MKDKALPEGWNKINITKVFTQISTTGKNIATKDCLSVGKYPVIDQGAEYISGYFNDETKVIPVENKVIVFGDHTRNFKLIDFDFIVGADGVKIFQPAKDIDPDFFYYQCLSLNLPNKGYHRHFRYLKECDFIYPSFSQQQKLAKKFTALLYQVAEIKQRLEKIPALLKTYRQSVLARAVNGELSAKWREENGVSLESWECGYIKDFVEKPIYGTSAKSQKEGKIPVLRMGNIQAGQIDWENLVYTSNDAEIQKYSLNKYDVLFNRTNSPELVGKTAIYLGEREAIFAGYLIRVRCKNMLNPKFLNYHLNSPFAKNYCLEVKSDGVSQSNINAQKLLAYPLNLPSLEEQNYITQAVEKHLNFANQLEARVNAALERVNLMTQAILAKGFRGELL
ncbi:restriction endonuclease subunit S [Glaesserella parasuis]|uniref:restriction endonuclease subunit S n=1 Tax=Glaesserella parasuis TaxID=738 RepID=UPI001365D983|nr:restriction endonuclease subunit S [Glaesserella parasuis]MDG6296295.1 restriction endonuclease subunit S [Glaesserella parasuis]MDO9871133.1 restriction endonuclease subunit S [Glaesserella parasuis]MDP0064477.1 restriction endonuclease subunit S [Glaesserella parasuis]MDP0073253.1 restriction endonuclease subunit S [Glaesserella parasuis]MDP0077182.1 restriction endonuclease subunit S [Glaesserella parasuis]